MKIQRIIMDEPIGICVGFTLTDAELEELGADADFWWLQSDNGKKDSVPVFVHDISGNEMEPPDDSCGGVIEIREEPEEPDEDWQPLGMDLEVWRDKETMLEDLELYGVL